jgi:hypothetical protein
MPSAYRCDSPEGHRLHARRDRDSPALRHALLTDCGISKRSHVNVTGFAEPAASAMLIACEAYF